MLPLAQAIAGEKRMRSSAPWLGAILALSVVPAGCDSGDAAGADCSGVDCDAQSAATACPNGSPAEAITADAGLWSWIPVEGMRCRDGSSTGIGVYPSPTGDARLLIFLEPGGACFDAETCSASAAHFDESDFADRRAQFELSRALFGDFPGIFAESPTSDFPSPFKGWNKVFVPYCSGDVHAGDNGQGFDNGTFVSQHHGFANVGQALAKAAATWPNASQVVLSGSSAGGFGAAFHFDQLHNFFCQSRTYLIDDSGPPLREQTPPPASRPLLPACLQQRWRERWNLNATLPAGCNDCRAADGGGLSQLLPHLATAYPDSRMALLSFTEDAVIRDFYGYDAQDPLCGPVAGGVMSAADFSAGLRDLRDNVLRALPATAAQNAVFFQPGDDHVFLLGQGLGNPRLLPAVANWLSAMVADDPGWSDVGP
ncbi:MAG: pectin acetylesterase-family hydrolase [Polyangiales bacterium]